MSVRDLVRRANRASIGIGVAGCGNAAELLHLPILRRLGVPIVALADPEPEALSYLGDRYGVERRYSDPAELVDDPGVGVIAVLTPPEVRAGIVIPALEAGKHVLVEKPLALTLAECDTMVDASAARPDVRAMAGLPLRFHRLVGAARELIASGRLGAPNALHMANFGPTTRLASGRKLSAWRLDRERGGGTLLDKGIHQYDLWRFLLGREVEEVSTVTRVEEGGDRASVVTALLERGAIASSLMVTSEETSSRWSIHGSLGRIDIDAHRFDGLSFQPANRFSGDPRSRLRRAGSAVANVPNGIRSLRLGGDFQACYEAEWRHFLSCLRGEADVASTLHDGREATRVALAALESARRSESVNLPAAADRRGGRPVPVTS